MIQIAICVLIIFMNGLVCLLVLRNRDLQTPTNGFLVSLAFSDFLVGALLVPLQLSVPESQANGYIIAIVLLSGVASVCAVTFDRFTAITKPLSHQVLMRRLFKPAVTAMWLSVIVTALLPLVWKNNPTLVVNKIYLFFLSGVFVVIPFVFIFVAHFLMFKRLKQRFKELQELSASSCVREASRRTSPEAKLTRIVFLIAVLFVLSWLPVLYMTLVSNMDRPELIPEVLPDISLFTVQLSSLVNPLLYSLTKPDFKRKIRSLLCERRDVVDERIVSLRFSQANNLVIASLAVHHL